MSHGLVPNSIAKTTTPDELLIRMNLSLPFNFLATLENGIGSTVRDGAVSRRNGQKTPSIPTSARASDPLVEVALCSSIPSEHAIGMLMSSKELVCPMLRR